MLESIALLIAFALLVVFVAAWLDECSAPKPPKCAGKRKA